MVSRRATRSSLLHADRRAELAIRTVDRLCASVGWTRPTVLITGFWRSGTTWLQQSLTATAHGKSVFEPLAPSIPAYDRWLARYELPSEAARHAFMPCLDAMNDHDIWRYLDRSFAGCSQGNAALLSRQGLAETWRRRVVVKCVRASFAHSAIHRRYRIPIVHLRRHPCAVVASLLRTRWTWSFRDIRLFDLHSAMGLDAMITPVIPELDGMANSFDTDEISRIAAYWAICERYTSERLRGRLWVKVIEYEELYAQPRATLESICEFLNLHCRDLVVTGDSPVTERQAGAPAESSRADVWRNQLSGEDIARIVAIITAVFPSYTVKL